LFGAPFLGSFLVLVGVALLAALLAFFLRLPSPLPAAVLRQPRPLREIARQGRFRLALAGGVVGYGIMNLLMTATPLAMMCARLDFAATATVIQWHLVAMFAPSFLTGSLIRRLGVMQVMLLGGALTLAAIGVALSGDELLHFGIALALVGIGWNFMYVGATTLLTETYREEEKALVQAGNDGLVFLGVTAATLAAGPLVDGLGWERVNIVAVLPVVLVMAGVLRALGRPRPVLASSA
jgi:predicted MFS family arabinose efflux permease